MTNQLALFGGTPVTDTRGPHYVWPRITSDVKAAVLAQLEIGEISIYDRSGIFAQFEDAFVAYHGGHHPHALLHNSGTTALWAMYEGAGLGPNDEVIVPAYSFYATYSPLLWTGAVPVFVDAGIDGNIDPEDIETKISTRTKAVVVTHMWGIPCDMLRIKEICDRHGLLLFEDCSHAHGAQIYDRKVGTWGDAAVWSLQGQKIVTGGEGGILLTNNTSLFERALLLGHYNKRCKQQISPESSLYRYALTGLGLKLRAHPLAIAIAFEQLGHLAQWIRQKSIYAEKFSSALAEFPFIHTPYSPGQPAWYAYVFGYDEVRAGVSIDRFVDALVAEGLVEVDRPGSTCLNHALPLFVNPDEVLPHLYSMPIPLQGPFPGAQRFFDSAIKLPVWAFADEALIVQTYIDGIVKVARVIQDKPQLFT